jgi:hypothetical protein
MGDAEQSVLQQMPAEMLRPGYTVWAPEDGDWLKVREVHHVDFLPTHECGGFPLGLRPHG